LLRCPPFSGKFAPISLIAIAATVSFVLGLAWRWETPALKAWVILFCGLTVVTLFWVFLFNYILAEPDDDEHA
jgi:uncharacterized membrane protein